MAGLSSPHFWASPTAHRIGDFSGQEHLRKPAGTIYGLECLFRGAVERVHADRDFQSASTDPYKQSTSLCRRCRGQLSIASSGAAAYDYGYVEYSGDEVSKCTFTLSIKWVITVRYYCVETLLSNNTTRACCFGARNPSIVGLLFPPSAIIMISMREHLMILNGPETGI